MPLATYYFEGLDFAAATTLYTDVLMSAVAPDGYYAGGGIVRRQVGGVLLTAVTCPGCSILCGNPEGNAVVSLGSDVGRMVLEVETGSSLTGVMAVVFYPGQKPSKVTWSISGGVSDSVGLYSSQVEGFVSGFIGVEAAPITDSGGSNGNDFPGFDYNWNSNSISWEQDAAYTIPVFTGSDCTLLASGDMKACTIPIPITALDSLVTITIENCLTSPEWTIDIPCPRPIYSRTTSSVQTSATNACAAALDSSLYVLHSTGDIAIHDWVFLDSLGVTKAPPGYYRSAQGGGVSIHVANGVVDNIQTCGV